MKTTKSLKAPGACKASSKPSTSDLAQPMASSSWMQLNTPEPCSIAALIEQQVSQEQLWSIHSLGDAIAVCHDSKCTICTTYAAHILDYKGSFNLSNKDIKDLIEKVWPCFFITLKQELTRPLEDKVADLKGQLKCTDRIMDDLDGSLKDVTGKNDQLID
jgi:hypothetical protein